LHMHHLKADYALTPDVAIIDPNFVMTMPKTITAHTGLDALCHAIESYVSILASDYTEGLSLKAIEMIFEFLPKAYHHGDDARAREKMHNASCIAGMAFTNAFLGINHSLAHKLGGEFQIPHGLANALLMPYVIAYNGELNPTKFVSFPRYDHFKAPRKYAEIATALKLKASSPEEGVSSLVNAIKKLNKQLDVPDSIQAYGIEEKLFMSKVDELAEKAFEDQCTPANPRLPLIPELAEILKKTYYGK